MIRDPEGRTGSRRIPITNSGLLLMQTMDELENEYLPLRDKVRELREYL